MSVATQLLPVHSSRAVRMSVCIKERRGALSEILQSVGHGVGVQIPDSVIASVVESSVYLQSTVHIN